DLDRVAADRRLCRRHRGSAEPLRPIPRPRRKGRRRRTMTAIGTMLRRQMGESRWFLGLASASLFGLGWLSSFIACRIEHQFLKASGADAERFEQFTRGMGGEAMDFSSLSFQVMFWSHPFVMLMVCLWAISRGSAAVAGEIERGTLDVTLS